MNCNDILYARWFKLFYWKSKYSKPILLSTSVAIKLIAVASAGNPSKVKPLKYVIKTAPSAVIIVYVNNEQILEAIENKGSISYFPNEFLVAIKKKISIPYTT
ncbi:chitobiase/beta-hexosaminidase C-terminal domain-containing protein [Metabacillus flavus]|uniref:chitobiase/beta-hexosaminidase C-terminal domain-containing protein n=1 Tax=Metabacillus flavus TaxID=2823519 RepID=UPI003D647782